MSWSQDLPIIWSRHVITYMIWSYDSNMSPMNFIVTSRHHRFQLLCHHLFRLQVIIDSNICITIPLSWLRPGLFHHWSTRLQPIVDLKPVLGGLTYRSMPIKDPVVIVWKGSSWLLLIKAIGESHNEWWVVRLAERSLSSTLEDVNISFNHSAYYSISRGEGRVVTNKLVAW